MRIRVGGLNSAPLWRVVRSKESERGELRGDASLRFSGERRWTETAGGLGLENLFSDYKLKSSRSCWDNVTWEG